MRPRKAHIVGMALSVALIAGLPLPAAQALAPQTHSVSVAVPTKDPKIPKEYEDIANAARTAVLRKYAAELARLNAAGAKARTAALVAERTRMNAGADLNAAIALEKAWKSSHPGEDLPDAYTPTVKVAQAAYKKADAAATKAVDAAFKALTAARQRTQQVRAQANAAAYAAVKEAIPDPDV